MKARLVFATLGLFFGFSTAHGALKFSPISMTFTPTGSGTQQFAVVKNDSPDNAPVGIKVTQRVQHEDGKEDLPATTDFTVFPPQFVLKPGESKTLKISWLGPKEVDAEKSYRISVEQLPVNVKKDRTGSGIDILVNYSGTMYVDPPNIKPDIKIKEVTYSTKDKKLVLQIVNDGTKHDFLKEPELTLEGRKNGATEPFKLTLKGEDLKEVEGLNILSKSARIVKIALPTSLDPKSEFKASLQYKRE